MTRFIVLLAVLFLIMVAADPAQYVEFGWTMGLFLMAIALFIGKLDKGAARIVFVAGALLFGITLLGDEFSSQIRIATIVAAILGILWLVVQLVRRRRRRRQPDRPAEQHAHQHQHLHL